MKLSHFFAASVLLLVATSVAAKQETIVICHVGSETGPNGETYLEDPAYDAGKVDLMVVTQAAKHLDNPSHCWGDLCDYEPGDRDATGVGTEDRNGDGVDDGCEPVGLCPCWAEYELQSVTAANQNPDISCSSVPQDEYPGAAIQNVEGSMPDVEGGFAAYVSDDMVSFGYCMTRDYNTGEQGITAEEGFECIAQIAARCAAIGDPIYVSTFP